MASELLGPHLLWALLVAFIMLACMGLAVFGVVAAVYGFVKRRKLQVDAPGPPGRVRQRRPLQ